ncbi:galactose oxidase early set domain-containing protein [Streptomyces sp. NBC_00299]|uniref:galactose oxidase early set domain-containing protein n=1 Tax=Streptomyces sp. NBC_00299 TaxID=2975705 RepID=UPI002E2CDD14|nr:galactose oxidase early set domain-containing protein [Streptomyces sp. NBC_00299]
MRTSDPTRISRVRLIRPGSATHVTDFDQRSVALDITRRADGTLTVRVPEDPSLVPPGWYMVVAVDEHGVPSPPSGCTCSCETQPAHTNPAGRTGVSTAQYSRVQNLPSAMIGSVRASVLPGKQPSHARRPHAPLPQHDRHCLRGRRTGAHPFRARLPRHARCREHGDEHIPDHREHPVRAADRGRP